MTTTTNFTAPAARDFVPALLAHADTIGLARDIAAHVILNSDDDANTEGYTALQLDMHAAARACYITNDFASFDTLDDMIAQLDELGLTA